MIEGLHTVLRYGLVKSAGHVLFLVSTLQGTTA